MLRKRPLIIAHRGASRHERENTIAAFQAGIDAGADGVEFDVRLAKDGTPVVIHDANLKRVAGVEASVAKSTPAELAGYRVPTFVDVLELFAGTRAAVHVELKVDSRREIRPLVSAVIDVVRASPLLGQIVLSSFSLAAISEAKLHLPDISTSALFAPSILQVLKRRRHMISLARSFAADGISPHRSLVTRKLVRLASSGGMPVTVWTCDKVKWVDRAADLGIAAVITNDPAKLVSYRADG